jgi:hypothetical protein
MKRGYRRVIADVATSPLVDRAAKQLLPDWVTVFMLHRIAQPELGVRGLDPAYLAHCLDYLLRNGYHFISLEEAVTRSQANNPEKRKWVAFSLDDGFADQLDIAGPILHQYRCPATFFLITGFLDGILWPWDHQLIYVMDHTRQQTLHIELGDTTHHLNPRSADIHAQVLAIFKKSQIQNIYELVTEIGRSAGVDIPGPPPPALAPTSWERARTGASGHAFRRALGKPSHSVAAG